MHTGTVVEKIVTPTADLGTERPQVQHVERRADEQRHRVDRISVLTVQKPQVAQAPQPDLTRLPAPDQQPISPAIGRTLNPTNDAATHGR